MGVGLLPDRVGRGGQRWSMPHHHTLQPETCSCWCVLQLGAETPASAGRPGERFLFGCAEIAQRAWHVVQAAIGGPRRIECESAIRIECESAIGNPLSMCESHDAMGLPSEPHCQHAHG